MAVLRLSRESSSAFWAWITLPSALASAVLACNNSKREPMPFFSRSSLSATCCWAWRWAAFAAESRLSARKTLRYAFAAS
ncbi:hypothetical protein D3C86_1195760 [compost metagenome]